jgi:hypothetical protein
MKITVKGSDKVHVTHLNIIHRTLCGETHQNAKPAPKNSVITCKNCEAILFHARSYKVTDFDVMGMMDEMRDNKTTWPAEKLQEKFPELTDKELGNIFQSWFESRHKNN